MKLLVSLFLIAAPTVAMSADADKKEARFEERKARKLEKMEAKDAMRAEHKACVTQAATKEAMKACKEKHRAAKKAFKQQYKKK